ncbi:MAG: tetratricopeptide repeat protein [Syntrophobacterales bacterium]
MQIANKTKHIRTTMTCVLTLILLLVNPVYGDDANDYVKLALESSTAKKKIQHLSKAIELDSNLASAYEKRGMLYYFQEKYDKVIQDFESYTRLRPEDAEGYRMLGMSYLYNESYDAAIANFTHALKVDPNLIKALCYRAEAYRLSGKDEAAVRDSTEVIQRGKEGRVVADAYITRAKVFRKIGHQKQAVADIRAALLVDPRTWFYRYVSNYASLEDMQGAGLIVLLVIAFVLIFKLKMKLPDKDD